MGSYQYKAIDERGRVNMGQVDAANTADLEMRLNKLNLDLINYKEPSNYHIEILLYMYYSQQSLLL